MTSTGVISASTEGQSAQCDSSIESLIVIAADSIEELRRVDVFRVLGSANVRRNELADFIALNRSDLIKEVQEVMDEEFPANDWKFKPVDLNKIDIPPAIPERVLRVVKEAIVLLRELEQRIVEAKALGARFGGGDRYVNDTLLNRAKDIEWANKIVLNFRENAAKNNIDPEPVLVNMGGVPVLGESVPIEPVEEDTSPGCR